MTRRPTKAILIKIPIPLFKKIEALAEKQYRSKTSVVLQACQEFFENEEKRK